MYILLAGLNHETAPLEIREKFTFSNTSLDTAYEYFKSSSVIEGVVLLNTCNRMEIYASCRDKDSGREVLEKFFQKILPVLKQHELEAYLYQLNCEQAIKHLFRVCAGLDSMILGESQIMAQVKEAYNRALDHDVTDGVINTFFQRALYVGKKVRFNTGIDNHSLSISYAAIELARDVWGDISGKSVLVIGAGEMAELSARYLMEYGVNSIIVSNRSYEKALAMAEQFNGRAIKLDDIEKELLAADIVISCTSACHFIIMENKHGQILRARNGKKLMFLDIAVPRDIDPQIKNIDGIYLYDIDDLKGVVDTHFQERKKAARDGEKIINKEIVEFNAWLASLYVVPVIASLRNYGEEIKNNELEKAFNRLGNVSEYERDVIVQMAHSIIKQFLHTPIINLKNIAPSNQGHIYAELTKKLFNLELCNNGRQVKNADTKIGNPR